METAPSEDALARRWYFALIAAYVAVLLNVVFPIVRSTINGVDVAALLVAQLLPFGAVVMAFAAWRGLRRLLAVLASVPLLLVALGGAIIVVGALLFSEHELLKTTRTGWSRISAYRTNGGATTAFGVIVRQEFPVLPGVMIVHQLAHEYPAHDVTVEPLAGRRVRLSFLGTRGQGGKTVVDRLLSLP